jgi:hypothetical protein
VETGNIRSREILDPTVLICFDVTLGHSLEQPFGVPFGVPSDDFWMIFSPLVTDQDTSTVWGGVHLPTKVSVAIKIEVKSAEAPGLHRGF